MNENELTTDQLAPNPKKKGFLNADKIRALSFYAISLCISVSVLASILAIWDFARADVLWRTVATCAVIAAGFMVFSIMNTALGSGHND